MYTKEFEVRWNDLDANRHMANSAYIQFMSNARLSCLNEGGFGQINMVENNLGPVVFYEQIFYFKEIFPGKPIGVTAEMRGLSDDGRFFSFEHNFYNPDGKNLARGIMVGGWIDLTTRKLRPLPDKLDKIMRKIPRSKNYKTLTKEDTRAHGQSPKDL